MRYRDVRFSQYKQMKDDAHIWEIPAGGLKKESMKNKRKTGKE